MGIVIGVFIITLLIGIPIKNFLVDRERDKWNKKFQGRYRDYD